MNSYKKTLQIIMEILRGFVSLWLHSEIFVGHRGTKAQSNYKNGFKLTSLVILLGLFFLSREQVINPTLQSASPVLVVDGWINNKPEKQLILLTQTQPYFEDAQPTGVSGAVVTVVDINDGTLYSFTENPSATGSYEWMPASGSFGTIGHNYKLSIALNGEVFESASYMGRVPPIDSITFEKDVRSVSDKTRYQGEFWAK